MGVGVSLIPQGMTQQYEEIEQSMKNRYNSVKLFCNCDDISPYDEELMVIYDYGFDNPDSERIKDKHVQYIKEPMVKIDKNSYPLQNFQQKEKILIQQMQDPELLDNITELVQKQDKLEKSDIGKQNSTSFSDIQATDGFNTDNDITQNSNNQGMEFSGILLQGSTTSTNYKRGNKRIRKKNTMLSGNTSDTQSVINNMNKTQQNVLQDLEQQLNQEKEQKYQQQFQEKEDDLITDFDIINFDEDQDLEVDQKKKSISQTVSIVDANQQKLQQGQFNSNTQDVLIKQSNKLGGNTSVQKKKILAAQNFLQLGKEVEQPKIQKLKHITHQQLEIYIEFETQQQDCNKHLDLIMNYLKLYKKWEKQIFKLELFNMFQFISETDDYQRVKKDGQFGYQLKVTQKFNPIVPLDWPQGLYDGDITVKVFPIKEKYLKSYMQEKLDNPEIKDYITFICNKLTLNNIKEIRIFKSFIEQVLLISDKYHRYRVLGYPNLCKFINKKNPEEILDLPLNFPQNGLSDIYVTIQDMEQEDIEKYFNGEQEDLFLKSRLDDIIYELGFKQKSEINQKQQNIIIKNVLRYDTNKYSYCCYLEDKKYYYQNKETGQKSFFPSTLPKIKKKIESYN